MRRSHGPRAGHHGQHADQAIWANLLPQELHLLDYDCALLTSFVPFFFVTQLSYHCRLIHEIVVNVRDGGG